MRSRCAPAVPTLAFSLAVSLVVPALGAAAAETATPATPPAPKPVDPALFDTSVKACDDFFQHAVGGWLRANPVPADKARWSAFEELSDRNRAILKSILEETSAKADWPKGSAQQKVGDFFASGLDEAAVEKAGTKPLAPWLAKVDGLESNTDLPKLVAELHAHRVVAGYGLFVGQDQKETTRCVPNLSQGGLGLPDRDDYLKDDAKSKQIREKYVAHVAKMLELPGDPADVAKSKAAVVMDLETKLAKAARTRVELRDPERNYNKRTLAQLVEAAPGYDWKAYAAAMGIPAGQELNVRQPEFGTAFAAMAAAEPLDSWKAYFRWHLVRVSADLLPKRFEEEAFAFYGRTLNGVPEQEERWKRVQATTDRALGEALGQLYVEKAFSPKSKERMKVLVENLRASLRGRIEAAPWMGPRRRRPRRRSSPLSA